MPKLKTKKGVAKRFKLTKKGKIKFKSSGKGHILTKKNSKRIRSLRKQKIVHVKKQEKNLKQTLPYG